jgi:DNA-binding HxlR family transcriptional regulator
MPEQPGRDRLEELREVEALAQLITLLRELVPPELQAQLTELIRQLLLLVRALVDWWTDRLDTVRGAEPEIEDIPLD